jgi:5'-nucleotidase
MRPSRPGTNAKLWAAGVCLPVLLACPKVEVGDAAPAEHRLTLVATNDFHGAFFEESLSESEARGGGGALAAAVARVRAEVGDEHLLVVDGGDLFQGSQLVNESRGQVAVELFNRIGYAAVAVGNHEFDYGGTQLQPQRALLDAAAAADFPFLTANIFHRDGRPLTGRNLFPSVIIERAGLRVGLLGLTTATTPQTTHPDGVANLLFEDAARAGAREARRLREEGADLVVALAHLNGACANRGRTLGGPYARCDLEDSELRALTELPAGLIDVVVAGHRDQIIAERIGTTLVLEQDSRGRALGRVDLVLGATGIDWERSRIHDPLPLLHAPRGGPCEPVKVPPESAHPMDAIEAEVDGWLRAEIQRLGLPMCEVEGCLAAPAHRSKVHQSAAGTLVAESMLGAFEGVDLAVQNGGGIRASLPAGSVRNADLYEMLPFDNRVVLIELRGRELWELLRIGTSGAHSLFQLAGARLGYAPTVAGGRDRDGDGAVGAWERERLCWVEIGGEPLDPDGSYRLATNDFLARGGDHATVLRDQQATSGPALLEVVRQRLVRAGSGCIDPTPRPDIIVVEEGCR